MSIVKNDDFKITKGQDKLKIYQFHSKLRKHYFCSIVEFILIIILDKSKFDRI